MNSPQNQNESTSAGDFRVFRQRLFRVNETRRSLGYLRPKQLEASTRVGSYGLVSTESGEVQTGPGQLKKLGLLVDILCKTYYSAHVLDLQNVCRCE